MSYRFFPSRQQNFFPPQVPYLSGFHGLGDYASDLASYNVAQKVYEADHAKWLAEKSAYDVAYANWQAAVKSVNAMNRLNASRDQAVAAAYDRNYAAYQAAASAWAQAFSEMRKANIERAKTISNTYGLSLPSSFYDNGACLSQAQHDAHAAQCTTVKGLGSLDPDCGWKALPVCNMPPRPTPPTKPAAHAAKPLPPEPTLRPEPKPPTPPVNTGGSGGGGNGGGMTTPGGGSPATDPGPITTTDDAKKAGLFSNGLILLAIAGGGYLVYRTLRKPKAAA